MNIEENNLNEYVRYRIAKANETYQAACLLVNGKMWNSAINRLYYACFYIVTALLLNRKIIAKTHSGVISRFSEVFVRSGQVSMNDFRTYSKLINWRSKGDYSDMFDFEEDDVLPLLDKTAVFIKNVTDLIHLEDI